MAGRRSLLGRLLLAALLFFTVSIGQAQAADIPVIIKVLPGVSISNVVATLSATLVDSISDSDIHLVNVPSLTLLQSAAGSLQLLGIEWYELNNGVTLPGYIRVGILQASGTADWYKNQPSFQLIQAGSANQYSTGRGIVVVDINSRVDIGHPALIGHLTTGYDFVANKPAGETALNQSDASFLDQSDASFLDQSDASFLDQSGASFLNQSDASFLDGSTKPAYSHGTLTVGVIAAIARDAMIMPLRAFDDNGSADLFILAKAVRYAVNQGAQVINMSFGTLENSKALKNSIDYGQSKGVILVASAGNSNTSAPQYPAAWSGVLTTAATDLFDRKASFSNYGYVFVDAPGVHIISAYPNGYYAMVSGTSFSSPEVAATAALVLSLRTSGVSNSVAAGAVNIDSKNPNYAGKLGYGRIDVLRSVNPY